MPAVIGAAAKCVRVTSSSVASVGASAAVPGLHVAETTAYLLQLQLLIVEKPPLPVHHLKCVSNPSILLLLMHLPPVLLLISVLLASLTPARLASLMPGLHSCNVTHERESCSFVLFLRRC